MAPSPTFSAASLCWAIVSVSLLGGHLGWSLPEFFLPTNPEPPVLCILGVSEQTSVLERGGGCLGREGRPVSLRPSQRPAGVWGTLDPAVRGPQQPGLESPQWTR